MNKDYKFRIINKSKDGITVKMANGQPHTMTWNEFNSSFIMTEDKLHCTLNEETKKVHEELEEDVNIAVVLSRRMMVLRGKPNKTADEVSEELTCASIIGEKIQKLQKQFPGEDIMGLIKSRYDLLVEAKGFGAERKRKNYKNNKSNKRLENSKPSRPEPQKSMGATQCLGEFEALKKLKESFGK